MGNLQELEAELYRVRKNGYACDLEENELHIRCVAAPIWDHAGGVNASLSITAPMVRMAVTRLRQLAPLIQAAGLQISRELGYQSAGVRSPLRKMPPQKTPLQKNGAGEASDCETSLSGEAVGSFGIDVRAFSRNRAFVFCSWLPAALYRRAWQGRCPIHAFPLPVPVHDI